MYFRLRRRGWAILVILLFAGGLFGALIRFYSPASEVEYREKLGNFVTERRSHEYVVAWLEVNRFYMSKPFEARKDVIEDDIIRREVSFSVYAQKSSPMLISSRTFSIRLYFNIHHQLISFEIETQTTYL